MACVLVIDDEPSVCYSLEKALASEELRVRAAGTAAEGIVESAKSRPTP